MAPTCIFCGDDHMCADIKTCPTCGKTGCVNDFGVRFRNGRGHLQSDCKECRKKYRRDLKPCPSKAKILEAYRKEYPNDKQVRSFNTKAKRLAKKLGQT